MSTMSSINPTLMRCTPGESLLAHAHGAKICRPGCALVTLYREATFFWGLRREASHELHGPEAQHIHCPGCGQPLLVVRKKGKFNGHVKYFVTCPLYFSADSRGREPPHLCHFHNHLQTLPTR